MRHDVTTPARNLGLISRAFQEIKGPRPIMIAYKIGQILKPVGELLQEFQKRLEPYIEKDGTKKEEMSEEHEAELIAILDEELTFEVPDLSVQEIAMHEKLVCEDDTVLMFLIDIGVLVDRVE